jgi:hypothetical protein
MKKEKNMNKKYILIAALLIFVALIVSAFSWAAMTRSNKSQGSQTGASALYADDDGFHKGYMVPVTGGSALYADDDAFHKGYMVPVTGGSALYADDDAFHKGYMVPVTGDSALYTGDDWFNKGYLVPVTGGSTALDAMRFRSYKGYQALDIYHQSERNFVQVSAFHYTPPGR